MSATVAVPALVAVPELTFAELCPRLEAAGWLVGAESQEPPLVAGEPHWCEFWRRDRDVTITYTFNPVVGLRVLAFSGGEAVDMRLEVAGTVPHLDSDAVRALLDRDEERARLLGLFAAAATHDVTVLDRVRELERDADGRVAAAAAHAREQILPAPLAAALEMLLDGKRAHPDRSALFAFMDVARKRQILRWLVHDFEQPNASIEAVLRSALADADPEVRITAVLAAARLHATGLVRAIAAAPMPESTSEGADPRERALYARLRDAVVKYLGTRAPGTPAGEREQWPPLYQALAGPTVVRDDMTLLLHALTTPLELGESPAPGPGVVADGPRWRLERSGLALAAVAPVPHWVGHAGRQDVAPEQVANRLRAVAPERGFFVAIQPLTARDVTRREAAPGGAVADASDDDGPGDPANASAPSGDDEPLMMTSAEAEAALVRLSTSGGVRLRLPTADEWEMAMRGPDGRLFPWGNNLAPATRGSASPWQVRPAQTLEWTADVAESAAPVVVGGVRFEPLALRRRAGSDTRAAVRPVVDAAGD